MKKGTKGMLIAVGAFAVAGIGFCIGGISVAAVETGGNVFDQAGQLLQDNDYPLAGLIHWGNAQYHSSDIDWVADSLHRIKFCLLLIRLRSADVRILIFIRKFPVS